LLQRARILVSEHAERALAGRLFHSAQLLQNEQTAISRISAAHSLADFAQGLKSEIHELGVPEIHISRFLSPIKRDRTDIVSLPPQSELIIALDVEGRDLLPPRPQCFYPTLSLYPPSVKMGARTANYVVKPLFFSNIQYGTIVFKIGPEVGQIYEVLALQLGNIYHEIQLLEAMNELNARLDTLSHRDELTGLFNRRGLSALAYQSLVQSRRSGKGGAIFYGDLDRLKYINDNYGHEAGDSAIIAITGILNDCFRRSDIIARMGGDEFCVVAPELSPDSAEVVQKRIYGAVEAYNAKKEKPFPLSLSIAYECFMAEEEVDLNLLISRADTKAYAIKRSRQLAREGEFVHVRKRK
jgi:diguanylate cyclase (GGDEF)-like protein